jgi:hypothetical protein
VLHCAGAWRHVRSYAGFMVRSGMVVRPEIFNNNAFLQLAICDQARQ